MQPARDEVCIRRAEPLIVGTFAVFAAALAGVAVVSFLNDTGTVPSRLYATLGFALGSLGLAGWAHQNAFTEYVCFDERSVVWKRVSIFGTSVAHRTLPLADIAGVRSVILGAPRDAWPDALGDRRTRGNSYCVVIDAKGGPLQLHTRLSEQQATATVEKLEQAMGRARG